MKKKIFIILVCLFAILGCLYGMKLENDVIEESTVETIEVSDEILDEIENTSDEEVVVSEEAEEIVRDTIQATEERRRFKYIRRNRKF